MDLHKTQSLNSNVQSYTQEESTKQMILYLRGGIKQMNIYNHLVTTKITNEEFLTKQGSYRIDRDDRSNLYEKTYEFGIETIEKTIEKISLKI